jgi:hypothetical protein
MRAKLLHVIDPRVDSLRMYFVNDADVKGLSTTENHECGTLTVPWWSKRE